MNIVSKFNEDIQKQENFDQEQDDTEINNYFDEPEMNDLPIDSIVLDT
eukprot:CAMPEP_0116894416 /NCGR_PEP_ID=MMETSP0467-20121206/4189_1 /TAXON_ID=283647 /ORGANISM="Mesodinium pulex, Strain SPMC105" /LENGTH=47 /DNA_ID= /DNA_START= /DNA_END= /DNA_ORIENTATION=